MQITSLVQIRKLQSDCFRIILWEKDETAVVFNLDETLHGGLHLVLIFSILRAPLTFCGAGYHFFFNLS